jgi:predicted SAM-dependent methyltransferase
MKFRTRVKLLFKKTINYGKKNYCPVCDSNIKKFDSLRNYLNGKFVKPVLVNGVQHFADDYETLSIDTFFCPVCGAQDKARLYALYLNSQIKKMYKGSKLKLVHFAPEGGLGDLLRNNDYINYRSADLFRSDVDDKADLTNLSNYSQDSFDIFICSHILEHIPNDKLAISELYRILKKNGIGIIMVPILLSLNNTYEDMSIIKEEDRLIHFGQEDHVRIYEKSDFILRLKNAGFNVNMFGVSNFGEDSFKKIGLNGTSVLYIVEKLNDNK